jgi:hypothetical protein
MLSYVALSRIEGFALTKDFMFNSLFKKFPGLMKEMLAESFRHYVKVFRRKLGAVRTKIM